MMKSDPDICLCNPVTDNFTTFEILIQTHNPAFTLRQSRTRRRYNDFCWLRKKLKKNHPMCKCPELPEKKNFSERFEIQFLVQRMKELENWLHRIVDINLYLSDTTLHLFLQTNLTCEQMDKYINGNLSELEVQQGYKEAELHLDKYIGTNSDLTSSMRGLSYSMSSENSYPVQIQTQHRAGGLHSTPDRSDSGIAEFESDTESSYDSQGSPYVSSLDSRTISENYPPLTEVTTDSLNKKPDDSTIICGGEIAESSSTVHKVVKSKHKTSDQTEQNFVYKIKTIVNPDVCGTDLEINISSTGKVKDGVNKTRQQNISEQTSKNVNQRVKGSDDNNHIQEPGTSNTGTKPKHKVQMGVLYC